MVPNTLWQAANPLAYDGGRATENTHLREFGLTDAGRNDDARWGGLQVVPTNADYILDLIRANSLWPLLSGLACCAFEMMSAATSKNDMDRWGMFPFRASPRQSDVLIVAGTLTTKMAGPLVRLWEQMPEPKWCVALGVLDIQPDLPEGLAGVGNGHLVGFTVAKSRRESTTSRKGPVKYNEKFGRVT